MLTRLICEPASQDRFASGTHSLSHPEWMALMSSVRETVTADNAAEQPESVRRILRLTRDYIDTAPDPCAGAGLHGCRPAAFQLPRRRRRLP